MDLVVSLHNQPKRGLQWAGISGSQLGRLSPNGSLDLNLSMIPVAPGLHVSVFIMPYDFQVVLSIRIKYQ